MIGSWVPRGRVSGVMTGKGDKRKLNDAEDGLTLRGRLRVSSAGRKLLLLNDRLLRLGTTRACFGGNDW